MATLERSHFERWLRRRGWRQLDEFTIKDVVHVCWKYGFRVDLPADCLRERKWKSSPRRWLTPWYLNEFGSWERQYRHPTGKPWARVLGQEVGRQPLQRKAA